MDDSAEEGRLHGRAARISVYEDRMYIKPKLERFGTFRELTLHGLACDSDARTGLSVPGVNKSNPDDCPDIDQRS